MIKVQALVDFIAKFTAREDEEEKPTVWMIWTNDLSNQRIEGAGVLLRSLEGDTIECAVCL